MKKRGAEKYTGQDGHFAHRRLPPSAVPDALHNVEGLLIDDRLVGILENLPLGRIVSYGLLHLKDFLCVRRFTVCPRYSGFISMLSSGRLSDAAFVTLFGAGFGIYINDDQNP